MDLREGGKITDRFGNDIWGATCYSCNLEIQSGAKGSGTPRWFSMDAKGPVAQVHLLLFPLLQSVVLVVVLVGALLFSFWRPSFLLSF